MSNDVDTLFDYPELSNSNATSTGLAHCMGRMGVQASQSAASRSLSLSGK